MMILWKKKTNQNVLKMIKSQKKNAYKISNDHIIDTRACLRLCQKLCISSNELSGYIQEINDYPFGFNIINDIQVSNYCLFH